MNLENYLQLPISERKEIVENADPWKVPFWLERLHTAVTQHTPLALSFLDKRLIQEYYNLTA